MMKKLGILLLILIIAGSCVLGVLSRMPEETPAPVAETTAPVPATETVPAETEPVPYKYEEIPAYFQTDYPYVRYGNGTIGTSGCSITCLAMAASYLTDTEYTPEELAWAFGSYGSTNVERLEYGIEQMQLPCEKITDWQQTKKALQEGKFAIALVDERSAFTKTAHFILLTGINTAGRYEVMDPFGPNYEEAYLKEGFEKGFTEEQILVGLEGCWIFDKKAMPEDPFRYPIDMPQIQKTRYDGFYPTDRDVYLLACFIWAAAREEPAETQQAVGELVLNRMVSDKYPDRVEDVMAQSELYSWYRNMDRAEPMMEQYMAVTAALYGPHILPLEVHHGAPWLSTKDAWGQLGSFVFRYEAGNTGG